MTQDELIRRMAEPPKLRRLRQQHDKLERERSDALEDMLNNSECERLRREIVRMGEEPVA